VTGKKIDGCLPIPKFICQKSILSAEIEIYLPIDTEHLISLQSTITKKTNTL